jgi:hypothetical protein
MGGSSGEFDFIGQILSQAPLILLAPFVLGALYIGAMVIIFRRAAARRRRLREARIASGEVVMPAPKPKVAPALTVAPTRAPEPPLDLLLKPPARALVPASPAEAPPIPPPPPEIIIREPAMPEANQPEDSVEVLRVYRDIGDGSLIVVMGGKTYRTADEVSGSEAARRLTAVVRELAALVGEASTPRPRIQPLSSAALSATPPGGIPGIPKRQEHDAEANRARRKREEAEPAGIADAVEEFLQFKLLTAPHLSARSVHIRPAPDGGVRIEVDGHYYDAIGDVVDADVREFLFGVMREWEARQ